MKLLELGQLFALPLQSAVRAQNLAFQETLSLIENLCTEEDGKVKSFRLKAERMFEERIIEPKSGETKTQFNVQPFELYVPLLALISPPVVSLQEINAEFGVEILETKTERIESSMIPSKALSVSLAPSLSSFTSLSQSNPTTMKVNMKITREIPEGMARLGDLMADLLMGRLQETNSQLSEGSQSLKETLGIKEDIVADLNSIGIRTEDEFLNAAGDKNKIKEITNIMGVTESRVQELRKELQSHIEDDGGNV